MRWLDSTKYAWAQNFYRVGGPRVVSNNFQNGAKSSPAYGEKTKGVPVLYVFHKDIMCGEFTLISTKIEVSVYHRWSAMSLRCEPALTMDGPYSTVRWHSAVVLHLLHADMIPVPVQKAPRR